jgi:two-component system sensor histidine kinase BarA
MQGDIGFSSEKNHGSSFWFTFQCEINAMPLTIELDNHHLVGKTILHYEENEHSRHATHNILRHWKMNVTSIHNPHQLAQLLSHSEQAVAGFEYALIGHSQTSTALSNLKKTITQIQPLTNEIHLAINSNSPSLQEALIKNGATSCLSKPLTALNLSKTLQPIHKAETRLSYTQGINSHIKRILPIKVLAVDDNEANLKLIKALLLEQVSEVVLAENGMEALELCEKENFTLIFMDIQMPVMDGISALKEIKTTKYNKDTPVIAVTAHALSGEKEKMHQQGFNAYMTKPIDESMLSHIIYEYSGIEHFSKSEEIKKPPENLEEASKEAFMPNHIIDWPLALKRSATKSDLAKEMLIGLIDSFKETEPSIKKAMEQGDLDQLKRMVHKLNGACCYTGTPNLAKITSQLETQLKMGLSISELEPEFLEFFEHIEQVKEEALKVIS